MAAEAGGWIIEWVASVAADQPLLFAFLLSFASNAVPYMTVPYLIAIASYSAWLEDPLVRVGLIVAGGVGAGLGKIVVFLVGRGFHRFVPEDSKRSLNILLRRFRKSMFLVVFLVAALPLPDDIVYVPLGVAGYSLPLYALAVILGKIVITGLAVAFGSSLQLLAGGSSVQATVAAIVIGVIVSVIVAKMRWTRVLEAYDRGGVVEATFVMFVEALCALVSLLTLNKLCSGNRKG